VGGSGSSKRGHGVAHFGTIRACYQLSGRGERGGEENERMKFQADKAEFVAHTWLMQMIHYTHTTHLVDAVDPLG
jgi:hypothetical protein